MNNLELVCISTSCSIVGAAMGILIGWILANIYFEKNKNNPSKLYNLIVSKKKKDR